jgi:hypothetical protein
VRRARNPPWIVFYTRSNNGVTRSNCHRLRGGHFLRRVQVAKLMPKFVGLYNADSSFMGEFRYLWTKLTKGGSCSLCDLTHGWNPFGKSSWKTACEDLDVPIGLLHKNEADPEQLSVIDSLPAIVNSTGIVGSRSWTQMKSLLIATLHENSSRLLISFESSRPVSELLKSERGTAQVKSVREQLRTLRASNL